MSAQMTTQMTACRADGIGILPTVALLLVLLLTAMGIIAHAAFV